MKNARVAYANERFHTMPLLINELDYDNASGTFADRYDTAAGFVKLVDILVTLIDQPDVAYALVPRNVFTKSNARTAAVKLAAHAVALLNALPAHRRPSALGGPDAAALSALASSDATQLRVLIYNRTDAARMLHVDLRNVAPSQHRSHDARGGKVPPRVDHRSGDLIGRLMIRQPPAAGQGVRFGPRYS